MSLTESKSWLRNEFHKYYDPYGYDIRCHWWEAAQKAQKKLRKKLGTKEIVKNVTIKKPKEASLPEDIIEDLVDDFCYHTSLDDKTIRHGIKIGMIGKVKFSKYIKKHIRTGFDHVDRLISYLGQLKKQKTVEPGAYKIKLSTVSKSFLKLGHYGPDQLSCFAKYGCHCHDKLNLSVTPYTFVCTITDRKLNKVIARTWGFTNPSLTHIGFRNLYHKYKSKGTIEFLLEQLCKKLITTEFKKDLRHDLYGCGDPHVCVNEDWGLDFFKTTITEFNSRVFENYD